MPESGRADMVSSGVFSGFGGGTENRQTALARRYTISCFRVLHYEHEAMGNTHFGALPEDRRVAALAALHNVLGTIPVEAAVPLTGGITTASVFRIDAGKHSYLLRVEGKPNPLRNPHQCLDAHCSRRRHRTASPLYPRDRPGCGD